MKITQKGWIYFDPMFERIYPDEKDLHFKFVRGDLLNSLGIPVREASITLEIPDDFDPRPQQIQQLEAKKAELQAKFAAAVAEINAQINSLQAIAMDA